MKKLKMKLLSRNQKSSKLHENLQTYVLIILNVSTKISTSYDFCNCQNYGFNVCSQLPAAWNNKTELEKNGI